MVVCCAPFMFIVAAAAFSLQRVRSTEWFFWRG